jgi:hypothetical protein
MTFVFEDCREGDTDGDKRSFKTKNGAGACALILGFLIGLRRS